MDKEALERIRQAYYSGLKVQIRFNGHWEDFDARDYSMYSDPFSENRLYRIVGSDYADMAEKQIAELEAQIEKMKCCMNCTYYRPTGSKTKWNAICKSVKANNEKCCKLYKWEIKENE